ncbi:hypothetical protein [Helicobacter cetorum]|nr:hypothetical protein [Helicobacter cetorum]
MIENTILNQEKEISRYNFFQERLSCGLDMTAPYAEFAPYLNYGA